MLKVIQDRLDTLEQQYPGIGESILRFENEQLPACSHCQSEDTATVLVGVVGRTIALVGATSKVTLTANGPKAGKYFCNKCRQFFN